MVQICMSKHTKLQARNLHNFSVACGKRHDYKNRQGDSVHMDRDQHTSPFTIKSTTGLPGAGMGICVIWELTMCMSGRRGRSLAPGREFMMAGGSA